MVFHLRIHAPRKVNFKSSHLRYASKTYSQNQVAVKLLGSFRLTAGNRHLHRYCIFTEQVSETVLQALHYSCASELTRQGISLLCSLNKDHVLFLSSIKGEGTTAYGLSCEPCCDHPRITAKWG